MGEGELAHQKSVLELWLQQGLGDAYCVPALC